MMYVNYLKCISRLFNALVQQLYVDRGTKRTVGIAAEISLPKILVEIINAVQSEMMELEMRINNSPSFFFLCTSSEMQ